jgi:hypothetical protein
MKVLSKIVLATLVGGLVAFGAGCGQEALPAGKSPEDVIKEALLNQKEITKSVFEVNAVADLKGDVDGEKNELKGTGSLKGTSNSDSKDNSFVLAVDGKMNGEGLKANLEVRANKDGVFAKIEKVEFSNKDTQDMVDLFIADYKGLWTKLSFASAEDMNVAGTFQIDYAEGDELPFKNIEYKGTKDILGIKSYFFAAKIDNEKLAKMMEDKGQGGSEDMLKDAEITAEIYTAVNEKIFTGFSISAKLKQTEMNGTFTLTSLLNPTKSNNVDSPKYDKELTEEDMMMLMGGGAAVDTTTDTSLYDESSYDTSAYTDVEGMTDEELQALMDEAAAVQ